MNIPQLQKKKIKWNILCCIKKDGANQDEKGFKLSFTIPDFQNFIPPNGNVTDFNLYVELGTRYPKLKTGIYTDSSACCLVSETSEGISLHGISHDLQKLRELIAKMLSSGSMRPKINHTEKTPSMQQLLVEWSEAILVLAKK